MVFYKEYILISHASFKLKSIQFYSTVKQKSTLKNSEESILISSNLESTKVIFIGFYDIL